METRAALSRFLVALVDLPFPHEAKCKRKLARLIWKRRSLLQRRGIEEDLAEKQAVAELMRFLELFGLSPQSIADLTFAEENFRLFTQTVDRTGRL